MRLYHSSFWTYLFSFLFLLLVGCTPPQATQSMMGVVVSADEQSVNVQVPAGSTVQQALDKAGLALGTLDRVEPPSYTLLTNGATIRVIRVEEEFTVEQEIIPFERKILQTESLPDQEKLLAQSGENGLQEITYRHVFEDGVEVSKRSVKYVVVKEAVPEVVMVGIQTPFTQVSIPGRLIYLLGGNAWMMEQTTANRRPLINSGDLDGRVFELSSDGNLLLFTRNSADEEEINTLWAAEITEDPLELIDLGVSNIIHFADWLPGSNSKIVFSTVEPRSTAPGWQANNDLYALSFSPTGWVSNWQEKPVLEPNSGGVYGWWGMDFVWSPDGEKLAYARPDSVGVLDFNDGVLTPTLEIAPLQTGGDWAWIPGVSWDPYGNLLYTVNHEPPEDSQQFDVTVIPLTGGTPLNITPQSGMFAYPITSPFQSQSLSEDTFQVAFLQAVFPSQSDTSRYRLMVMDRDGSNQRSLFPAQGEPGLEPQQVVWSPEAVKEEGGLALAVIYQGDLWLVNAQSGQAQQITGDGLTSRIAWKLVQ